MENNWDSLSSIINSVNKQYGAGTIVKGSETRGKLDRISTGILSYDLMLGGGWPVNQWSEIIGEESSGKTALAFKTIATNQALNPDFICLWVAAEEFVPEYAESIGVDLERLWIVETNIMEHAYNLVINVMSNRAADMIVIDSLPSEAQKRSLITEERVCTGLMINQWRQKIGVMWGDPRTTPGGLAKNFAYFCRVEVKRDEWLKDKDEVVGQTIKARTLKNKTYRPNQSAVIDFYFAQTQGFEKGDYDTLKDMINIGIAIDVITRAGAYYSFGEGRWQGKDKMLDAFREDLDMQKVLIAKVEAHYGVAR